MRAMILAAGLGTRLLPYTKSLPKPLLPVNGKPLIAYPLGLVKEAGVKDVVVNVCHLADQIESALKACSTMGLNIRFARERNLLETGGGLSNAQGFLGNETFFLLNSDVVCDIDLKPVLEAHIRSGAIATMVLVEREGQSQYAPVVWDSRSKHVKDLRGELGVRTKCSRSLTFAGIHVMEPAVFDYLLKRKESIIDAFYLPALREGRHIHGYLHSGYWADAGTVQDYVRVRRDLAGVRFSHLKPVPLSAPISLDIES